ncbi:hypothetical protein BDZ45DRAFT_364267 [Acephala macrosclerotiorum]|nr:hypothetical protein BDZ45DRAFT_364267 [Acephala macrosclerotiorum]
MSARIFSYEDANPVTFHIQPYFPPNAVTNFIALSFKEATSYISSTYATLYAVLYTVGTWSFHDIDTLGPVFSLVESQNWVGLAKLILSGPWDSVLAVLAFSIVLYLYYAGFTWGLLAASIFALGPWNLYVYGCFLLCWYWGISLIAKIIVPLLLIKVYRAIYLHFVVRQHLDAGRGGTAADASGWFRLWRLRLFGQIPSNFDIHVSPFLKPYRGILHADYLPKREDPSGVRPTIIGTAPQRQKDQKTSIQQYELLGAGIAAKAAKHARDLIFEGSFLEVFGGTQALRLRRRDHPAVPEIRNYKGNVTQVASAAWSNTTSYINRRPIIKQFGYELCHAHHADGSMHVVLHPEDVRTVIEQGWGERHPLACTTWIWMTYFKLKYKFITKTARPPIPETLVFVYAPKNEDEINTVLKIVDASIWYFTGKEVGSNIGRGPEIQDRYDDEDGFRQPKSTLDEVDVDTANAEYATLKLAAEAAAQE